MGIILAFYRNFIWPATLTTLVSSYLLIGSSAKNVVYMVWMKLITNFLYGTYFEFFHTQQFYFFNNLGYSKLRLYTSVVMLDLSIWLALTVSILLI
jgi:hypothetical protein